MELIRWFALTVLILFSAYTIYVVRKENFWKSLTAVWKLKWGKQVIGDLYIGLLLFHFFVYLVEGSVLKTLAWLIPALIIGNPITLLYFVMNFDRIAQLMHN